MPWSVFRFRPSSTVRPVEPSDGVILPKLPEVNFSSYVASEEAVNTVEWVEGGACSLPEVAFLPYHSAAVTSCVSQFLEKRSSIQLVPLCEELGRSTSTELVLVL